MFNYFAIQATRKFGQLAAGLLTGLCFSISATAQIGPIQERDIGIRNQQELQRQQQQEQQQRHQLERAPDVRLTTPEKATSQTQLIETPCFLIERLQLQNGSGLPLPEFDWVLEQLTAPDAPVFIGQCVGAQGVAWLIERTQKILVDRGFVTSRIFATQQDVSQGTLALTLIPGRIRAIRMADPVDPRANLSNALPMQAGDILNLRDIEQALENLKRVPTAEADIQIEPAQGQGAQLGDSDLVVSYHQPFPLRLTVNADDSGTKATGRYQGSVTVSYDNALTLNDLFYVTNTNSHSAGNFAVDEMLRKLQESGATNAAVGTVTMFGSPVNAQDTSDKVNTVTGGQGVTQQATHVNDFVSRRFSFSLTQEASNPATGGNPNTGAFDAHSSYTGELTTSDKNTPQLPGVKDLLAPDQIQERTNGSWGYSRPVVVPPRSKSAEQGDAK
jgi:hemolysin activation/secretion protein